MEPLTLAILAAVLAVVAVIFLLLGRRMAGADAVTVTTLRTQKTDLEQRLAVAANNAARLPTIEAELRQATAAREEAREALARVQTDLSGRIEVLAYRDAIIAETKGVEAELRRRIDELTGQTAELGRMRGQDAAQLAALAGERDSLKAELARQRHDAEAQVAEAKALAAELRRRIDELTAQSAEQGRKHGEEAALVAALTRERDSLKGELTEARREADEQRALVSRRDASLAQVEEKLVNTRRDADEKLKLLQEARDAMTRDFKLLSDEILARHGAALVKQTDEHLNQALNPLRQKLLEFQQSLQTAHTDSEKERARLGEQIRALTDTSARMSRETQDLTQALRGKSQTQGAWGEMVLETILAKSGLRDGEEYVAQGSQTTEDGDRLRPDVIVRLPGQQSIVIDAKVSLTAYMAATAADNDVERGSYLKSHVQSVRQHIRELASKDYQKHAAGALDYVVMFVPIEGALAAALTEAPDLTAYAVENSVYIATPTTLMIALRTAANVWHVEKRNRNADEISRLAGSVYDKVIGFLGNMDQLDRSIENARTAFNRARGQLATGKGNVLVQLERLKEKGARTSKALPSAWVEGTADDAPDEAALAQESLPGLVAEG